MLRAMTGFARANIVLLSLLAVTLPAGAQTLRPESGTLVVVNKRANTASIIDVASGKTISTLTTG